MSPPIIRRGICDIALGMHDHSQGDAAALRHLLEFLRCEGVIPAEKISACPTDPGGTQYASIRALPTGSSWPGQHNDRQLRSVHPQFSRGLFR